MAARVGTRRTVVARGQRLHEILNDKMMLGADIDVVRESGLGIVAVEDRALSAEIFIPTHTL